jgi:hypothetical protein
MTFHFVGEWDILNATVWFNFTFDLLLKVLQVHVYNANCTNNCLSLGNMGK